MVGQKLILKLLLLQASKKLDDPTRCDILELLGELEGELQAKDIAIATLKVSEKFNEWILTLALCVLMVHVEQ